MPICIGFCLVTLEGCEVSLSIISAVPHKAWRLGGGYYPCSHFLSDGSKKQKVGILWKVRGNTKGPTLPRLVSTLNPTLALLQKMESTEVWWEPQALPRGKEVIISSITSLNFCCLICRMQSSWPYLSHMIMVISCI